MRAVAYLASVMCVMAVVVSGWAGGASPPAAKPVILPISPASLAANDMEIVWQSELIVLDPVSSLKNLWLCDKYLVGCTQDNRVYIADATTGVRLGWHRVAETYQRVWPPAAFKDTVWVPTTSTVWGFREPDTVEIGHTKLDFTPAGGAVANGAQVFMPDAKGWLQAVAVGSQSNWNEWAGGPVTAAAARSDGILRVEKDPTEQAGKNFMVYGPSAKGWLGVNWGRWTEDAMTATPVLDSAQIYFAGTNGVVYASQQNVRRVLWEYQTEGPIVADLKRTKSGLVLVASLDYSMYAFQPSGRLMWRFYGGEPLSRTPYTTGNQAFVFAKEMGMTAVGLANGKAQWTLAEGADFVSSDPSTVYILSRAGDIMAVNRTDGKVRFRLPIEPGTLIAPNETDNGILYLLTPAGRLEAAAAKKPEAEAKSSETTPKAP